MKLIDTHCHVSFAAYKDDAEDVVKSALDEDIWMITVGTQKDTSKSAIEMAEKFDEGIYATIGLHPTHTVGYGYNDTQELDFKPRQEEFDPAYYKSLLDSTDKVVAVGECGLDYYRMEGDIKTNKKKQYESFMAQAQFAAENNLPLVIHCRDAHDDQFAAIQEAEEQWKSPRKGVIHCFTGTLEEAQRYVEIGWYVSFSGIAVFADEVGRVAQALPMESLLVETDAPYLTPPPYRGKRNEPAYVKYVAEDIARRKGVGQEEFNKIVVTNAKQLFNL